MNKINFILSAFILAVTYIFISDAYADGMYRGVIKDELYYAADHKDTAKIEQYLNLGYSIDEVDVDGMTALCEADIQGNDDAYNVLVKYGANEKHSCMDSVSNSSLGHAWAYTKQFFGGIVTLGALTAGALLAL